jgi:hypothetical protein
VTSRAKVVAIFGCLLVCVVALALRSAAAGADTSAVAVPTPPLVTHRHDSSPAAQEVRAASASAYKALTDSSALAAVARTEAPLLQRPAWKPTRLLSGAQITGYGSDQRTMTVRDSAGDSAIMASTLPIRVADGDTGLLAAVDLGLERRGGGYRDVNAYTPVSFPIDLAAGIGVGDIRLTFAGAGASGTPVDDAVVWPNALADTDIIAQAAPAGAEISLTLRSPDSPTDFPVQLSLPVGTTWRLGSAVVGAPQWLELVDATGRVVGAISAPVAADADQVSVATEWRLTAGRPTLHVDHQGADVHWPILVDPTVFINDERYGQDLVNRPWAWYNETGGPIGLFYGDAGWGPGLYQSTSASPLYWYSNNSTSFWQLDLSGRTVGITQVHAGSMNHDDSSNPSNGYGAQTCTFIAVYRAVPGYPLEYPWQATCGTYRGVDVNAGSWSVYNGQNHDFARVGIQMVGDGYRGYFQQFVPILVAAIADIETPTVTSVSGPSGWQSASALGFTASANDPGTGVRSMSIAGDGQSASIAGTCPPQNGIVCDVNGSGTAQLSGLSDGVRTITATANDVVGHTDTATTTVAVDRAAPMIGQLSGTLYDNRPTSFADTRAIRIPLSGEGSVASPSERRSGVHRIRLIVDGDNVVSQRDFPQKDSFVPAVGGNDNILAVNAAELTPGSHTVQVDVGDWAGNTRLASSFTITTTADVTPPGRVSDIQASRDATSTVTTVSWATADDPGLPDGTRAAGVDTYIYRYRIGTGGYTAWTTTTNASFDVSGLANGQSMSVSVQAKDRAGNTGSTFSATTSVSTPGWTESNVGNSDAGESGAAPTDPEPSTLGDYDDGLTGVGGGGTTLASTLASTSFILCPDINPCGSYNGAAAAAYALYWWDDGDGSGSRYNSKYFSYFGGNGGDCTNFVSQALKAGGMHFMRTDGGFNSIQIDQNIDKVHHGEGSWWAGRGAQTGLGGLYYGRISTASWNRAYTLYGHLLDYGLATTVVGTANVRVGDVVFWNFHDGGAVTPDNADHTQIVVRVTSRGVVVAQHSQGYVHTLRYVLDKRLADKGQVRGRDYNFTILRPRYSSANIP